MILGEMRTIPTIHDIAYLVDVIKGMARGDDRFRDIRRLVAESRSNIEVKERVSPSLGKQYLDEKLRDPSYMWNQSAKILRELMQLGLVNEKPLLYSLTSRNKAQNELALREQYELTEDGLHTARLSQSDYGSAIDRLLYLMYEAHPRLRAFIGIVQSHDFLLFPELTAGMVEEVPIIPKEYIEDVCNIAAQLVYKRCRPNLDTLEASIASILGSYVLKRMRSTRSPREKLSSFVIKAVNRGTKGLILENLGLKVNIPSFEVMTNWCKQFQICNSARGLLDMPGLALYMTAHVETNGMLVVKRRMKELVLYSVVEDIPKFFHQFKTRGSPWTSIYPIRAAICFKNRINDEVFDEIIRDIFFKKVEVDYKLALETDLWKVPPRSTRPLTLNGREKRNIISIYDWKGE